MLRLSVALFAACVLLGAVQPQPARAADAWQIDPAHSSIVWNVGHMNGVGKVYGRFNKFSGTIVTDEANLQNSSVEVVVEASSVDTAISGRDDHLRNADFFNVAVFPELSFKSTSVAATDEDGVYEVTGELTMLGVSKPLTIEVHRLGTGTGRDGTPVAGFESMFSIKRSEWGMGHGIPGTSDLINVMLAFECKGPAPAAAPAASATN